MNLDFQHRKQRVVARSSTEAEYQSMAYTSAELIWIHQLLQELQAPIRGCPLLLCDNVGAIFLTKNPVISTRSKHIALDFHFICEQVDSKKLLISPVSSVDQVADIFTKPLHKDRFAQLRYKLQVRSDHELAGGVTTALLLSQCISLSQCHSLGPFRETLGLNVSSLASIRNSGLALLVSFSLHVEAPRK
ncbi:hypothetical protein L2E82_27045 [Cichorium intybus]|uniref:Uncharacterized protein n=1 Tax=Cichorium intybus TaxID=13427 RepID=A0ACB9CS05_CICIN|nr:hypothetical protein L2E82_27045 [Cichorium intybus]